MADPPLIMLVEDNESHAVLTIRSLEDHPFKCRIMHAWDGEDALEYLFRKGKWADAQSSPSPNLILLDLRLPKIDGLDVLKIIKNADETRGIPVIVLTSSVAEPDIVGAYEYHANSYLTKPVDYNEFRSQIHDLVTYWFDWNIYPL